MNASGVYIMIVRMAVYYRSKAVFLDVTFDRNISSLALEREEDVVTGSCSFPGHQ